MPRQKKFSTVKPIPDAVPLEESQFFESRLRHLMEQFPKLFDQMQREGKLLYHLRDRANRALLAEGKLLDRGWRQDQAREKVMADLIADPSENPEPDNLNPLSMELAANALKRFNNELLNAEPTYQTIS